jgi:UDP-N-acetylmuramoyl-tripeptide--D-alanyl-D-alanine ligase
MTLTRKDIVALSHVQALGFERAKGTICRGISTDSRALQRDDLFIALRGEKFDGHNFITKAVESGAGAIVADTRWAAANQILLSSLNLPTLIVEDTIRTLGQLAHMHRKKFRIPILVVGGSNGKTTTKEMITAVLGTKYRVLSTEGNLNNHIGVPQTLLRLDRRHQIAVIEIGTNHFGEIAYLSTIAEPTHALITNVGREHLEFFGTVEGVAKAEGEVLDWLRKNRRGKAIAFINRDDQHLSRQSVGLHKILTYGFGNGPVTVRGKLRGLDDVACARLEVKPRAKKAFQIELAVPGQHNALNALAAATVGLAFSVPVKKIEAALSAFTSASKRMQVLHLNGITVLNDTYNSNPDSVAAALEVLGTLRTAGKKIAVLADMLELGTKAIQEHQKVGRAVTATGVTHLLTFGTLSKDTCDAASASFKQHYELKNVLAEQLAQLLAPGDVVLIKGSRGMKMEEVVAFLAERFKQSQDRPGQAA